MRYNGGMTRDAWGDALYRTCGRRCLGCGGSLGLAGLELMLDFDGTLSPIVSSASGARVDGGCKEALEALAPCPEAAGVCVGPAVVGRGAAGGLGGRDVCGNPRAGSLAGRATAGASAGARGRGGYRACGLPAQGAAAGALRGYLSRTRGLTIAVHYRNAPEVAQPDVATLSAADEVAAMQPLRVQRGRRLWFELQPSLDENRGTAVLELLEERAPNAALYVGDDYTDAAAMRDAWDAGAMGAASGPRAWRWRARRCRRSSCGRRRTGWRAWLRCGGSSQRQQAHGAGSRGASLALALSQRERECCLCEEAGRRRGNLGWGGCNRACERTAAMVRLAHHEQGDGWPLVVS